MGPPTLTYAEGSIGPLNLDASRHKQSISIRLQTTPFFRQRQSATATHGIILHLDPALASAAHHTIGRPTAPPCRAALRSRDATPSTTEVTRRATTSQCRPLRFRLTRRQRHRIHSIRGARAPMGTMARGVLNGRASPPSTTEAQGAASTEGNRGRQDDFWRLTLLMRTTLPAADSMSAGRGASSSTRASPVAHENAPKTPRANAAHGTRRSLRGVGCSPLRCWRSRQEDEPLLVVRH
jgi:hypothetical protein